MFPTSTLFTVLRVLCCGLVTLFFSCPRAALALRACSLGPRDTPPPCTFFPRSFSTCVTARMSFVVDVCSISSSVVAAVRTNSHLTLPPVPTIVNPSSSVSPNSLFSTEPASLPSAVVTSRSSTTIGIGVSESDCSLSSSYRSSVANDSVSQDDLLFAPE